MAASPAVLWSTSNLFCLSLLFSAVTTNGNTTSYILNMTLFWEQNVTYDSTDNYPTTQPTEFEPTTQRPTSGSTQEPAQPTLPIDPLPAAGRLLSPVSSVDRLCPCDEHKDVCDINCCCDKECNEEVALFTSCSVDMVRQACVGNKQLCSRDVASYSLGSTIDGYSELQLSVQKEMNYDIFCIQSQNRVDGFSHPSPTLPTDSNFDLLFKQFTSFMFGSAQNSGQVSTAELQVLTGYQYGDVMMTAEQSGQRGIFWLPAPSVTADCMDTSPAVFLKDQSSQCSRHLVLEQHCSNLPALSLDTYANIKFFALVPVEVASVILQSVDGTQTEQKKRGGENLIPVLLNPTVCANVVLKVAYLIKYNPTGEIVNVTVSLVLGFVREELLPLEQGFHVTFLQEDGEEVAVHNSGNPGYVLGLPLVLEDAANCSLVFQVLLDVLRGPNYPQYVASFGNSPLDHPLDWVPIRSNFNPKSSSISSPNSSPDPSFCLQDRLKGCGLLGLPVPTCQLRQESHRPTWSDGGLLLQPDGIPYFQCPPPGSGGCRHDRHQRETLRPQLRTAASTMEAENMVHSDSMSPASLGICEKLFRRWELKTSLTEGSARRSQQTLTIRLGLPGTPEPKLCVEVSPTISGQYLSTSYMSSGSFPPSEVTFHVPIARVLVQGLGRRGPPPRLLPKPHCTGPLMDLPVGGEPTEAQSCGIPLSFHLEIEWTKYGSMLNPQAQIVSIKEVIQTNTTSLARLSGGSSVLSVRSSVAFIPVSASALSGYRATPTINAKLPFDFFFPFV
ncbi:hypothetical protein L3Q82_020977 [Scortum barcoo]|uniref:Uncharacterized protein n=1 Tax=Scortum barcoo TaxID=214431 RepID=A0ACB8VCB8_9TELE|nr:hypothetical protein L3Q82_020977 [Scortum barcoo]